MTSTSGQLHRLNLYLGFRSSTTLTINIFKPVGVVISKLFFFGIYYSTAVFTITSRDLRWGGTVNLTSNGGTYTTANMWSSSEMIVGMAFFQVHNESSVIDYQSTYQFNATPSFTVFPQSPYQTWRLGLKSVTTSHFNVFRMFCPNLSHFYNTVDYKCYSFCPAGTVNFSVGSYQRCYGCKYTCLTCSSISWDPGFGTESNCTSCNSS